MSYKKIIEVSAAVITKEGNILATQRGYGEFKGKWEFPGGKIQEGETKEEALIREIKEELHADIKIEDYLTTVEYSYPEFDLIMHTFLCTLNNGLEFVYHNDKELEHENMVWVSPRDIEHFDWLAADIDVVKAIKKAENKYSLFNVPVSR